MAALPAVVMWELRRRGLDQLSTRGYNRCFGLVVVEFKPFVRIQVLTSVMAIPSLQRGGISSLMQRGCRFLELNTRVFAEVQRSCREGV